MCGIVGYTGKRVAAPLLVSGLKRLEYRGYDSAGIALAADKAIKIWKEKGKVLELTKEIEADPDQSIIESSQTGIAHTRWATHGPPVKKNAHPHAGGSEPQRIALVHNGIIENYRALKSGLEAEGRTFHSDTDTEVLAQLVDHLYEGDLLEATTEALNRVDGTFGIVAMSADEPGTLIVARRGSPIVIGVGPDETIIASDAAAIITHTRNAIYLDDNDIAKINGADIDVRTLTSGRVSREPSEIDWSPEAAEKGGYDHYMLKEIYEQPDAIRNAIRGRLDMDRGTAVLSGLNLSPREMVDISRLVVVGCGTSLNAGLVGEYATEDFCNMHAEVEQAAEFRYRNPIIGAHDFVLAVSQSGETADTLAATREAQEKGALVAGLVNVVGSTIARETGRGIYLHAGPEISVASTKAFTCQVSVLLMIALKFARSRRMSIEEGQRFAKAITEIPELVEKVLKTEDSIIKAAEKFAAFDHCFFIGRGYMFPVALEGALKLKEISYIHAEAYHAAELKHGPIALLEESMPVVALLNQGPGMEKTLSNVHECRARSAPVLGVITEGDTDARNAVDFAIEIPECPMHTAVIPATVALQLFSYHVARLRGCPIDQPRNLAKSVTVE